MSQEPYKLLTLVIPTYNMEKYLTKCLESVTAPCIPPTLEVIVVNDGSKDRSLDIMKAFQQKRPDIIRIIDKENGHYGSCINAGLQMAKGKYFSPLDADDWMDTEVLSKLLNVLKNCDTDLFITLRTEHKIDKNNRHIVTHFPFRNVVQKDGNVKTKTSLQTSQPFPYAVSIRFPKHRNISPPVSTRKRCREKSY